MNYETKAILKASINKFLECSAEEKENLVQSVRNKLNQHDNALNSIGIGYEENLVNAGKIFLRIYN